MNDDILGIGSGNGKFMKQYFIYFPDGSELHAWIFLTSQCHLVYGHSYKKQDGEEEIYSSAHERDFFEYPELDETILDFLKSVAMHSKSLLRVIDFPPTLTLEEQYEAMENVGIKSRKLENVGKKYEEIKWLEDLWNRGSTNMTESNKETNEDYSSTDWLLNCVHKWESANKEKGRICEFFGAFLSIDTKNGNIADDKVFVFGLKKTILNTLKEIGNKVRKEKNNFINW
jgi:hypothetical protein